MKCSLLHKKLDPYLICGYIYICYTSDTLKNYLLNMKDIIRIYIYTIYINRGKFRSQTSDQTDRWKSRGGKSQRGEEQREKIREEKE